MMFIYFSRCFVFYPTHNTRRVPFVCSQEGQIRPLIVKRGIEGFDISDGERTVIDHLVFLVHGIGSVMSANHLLMIKLLRASFRFVS